jgi:hypothetical protein
MVSALTGTDNIQDAYLESQIFPYSTSPRGRCLTFWYYMTGTNAGTLSFYVVGANNSDNIIVWSTGGADLGEQWNYGAFGFYYDKPYKINIVGKNMGSNGVIAIDDILFQESKYCGVNPPSAMAGTGLPLPSTPLQTTKNPITPLPSVYDCNFEKDLCTWKNDLSRPLKWTRNRGSTSSFETGPTIDHTYDNSNL